MKFKAQTEVVTWKQAKPFVGWNVQNSSYVRRISLWKNLCVYIYQVCACVCVRVCFNQSQFNILFNSTYVNRSNCNGICCECETCNFSFVTFSIDDKMLQFIFVFVCTSAHVDAMRTEICEMPSNQNDVEKLKYLNAVCGVCVSSTSSSSSSSFSLHISRRSG